MNMPNVLPLALGVVLFSFFTTSIFVVPFISLLYKMHFLRRKEAPKEGKVPLFDKLHDKKAGTPTGGGVLLIVITCLLFALIFPGISYFGVFVHSAHKLKTELFLIFFTFISFGILGLSDDIIKIFGKGRPGLFGIWLGMSRKQKFFLQFILSFFIGYVLYKYLGIQIIHIPLINKVIDLGFWYVPFSAFTIVFFTNAFNFTDGLDGLALGLLIIFLISFGIIAAGNLDTPLSLFIALWIGTIFAFLYFNIWPARIFLGDAGALSFGAMIALIGLLTGSAASLFIIGGLFVLEAFSSAVQILGWKFLKKPIFPLAPIHHSFLAIGWEEPKIVMRAWLAGVILAIFGLWLATV